MTRARVGAPTDATEKEFCQTQTSLLEELEAGGKDASAEARKQADAFEEYLTETCGNPLGDLEMPGAADGVRRLDH